MSDPRPISRRPGRDEAAVMEQARSTSAAVRPGRARRLARRAGGASAGLAAPRRSSTSRCAPPRRPGGRCRCCPDRRSTRCGWCRPGDQAAPPAAFDRRRQAALGTMAKADSVLDLMRDSPLVALRGRSLANPPAGVVLRKRGQVREHRRPRAA
ncbi:MAG TPA: hypothetical protein VHQ90_15045 [Thermoanaerobaculia bacterium]|nr:hypothetical protein [Thermoanaerobaculia bacterium]